MSLFFAVLAAMLPWFAQANMADWEHPTKMGRYPLLLNSPSIDFMAEVESRELSLKDAGASYISFGSLAEALDAGKDVAKSVGTAVKNIDVEAAAIRAFKIVAYPILKISGAVGVPLMDTFNAIRKTASGLKIEMSIAVNKWKALSSVFSEYPHLVPGFIKNVMATGFEESVKTLAQTLASQSKTISEIVP